MKIYFPANRRGDTAITPKEQRVVLDALKKAGVT